MASKRELVEPHDGDKRFVRRDSEGRFNESDDVSRSLSQDRKRNAKNASSPGQGDKGDRKSGSSRSASGSGSSRSRGTRNR